MQYYRVKLKEGHTARPEHVVNGYLGNDSTIDPSIYTLSEANKMAEWFYGEIEPFGKNYGIDDVKVIQISRKDLSNQVLKELQDREVFTDTDCEIDERIYYGSVFETILGENGEQTLLSFNQDIIDELLVLDTMCGSYQYVMLTSI
jgi:hypothetical protein